jgi:hypothetical protein
MQTAGHASVPNFSLEIERGSTAEVSVRLHAALDLSMISTPTSIGAARATI